MTGPDSASLQSPRLDENKAGGTESHEENTKADDAEDETATVTGNDVVKADNDLPPNPPQRLGKHDTHQVVFSTLEMIKEPLTRPITQKQLTAEVAGIYAGLVMVESKSIEYDIALLPDEGISLDVIRILEMIPDLLLRRLQDGEMLPHETVRTWLNKVHTWRTKAQKDATEGDVSEKSPQVPSVEDCMYAFRRALVWHIRELGRPECESSAAPTTAEIGEEGCAKATDRQDLIDIVHDLVNELFQDLETAAAKIAEKEAKEAAQAKAEAAPEETEAAPEKAGVAAKDLGKDMADTAVGTVAHTKETKPEFKINTPTAIDLRPLIDQNQYRKVGKEIWVLINGQFIPSLAGHQYQALIALHRTLLHEHHDFFLASQHPIASPKLQRLAATYAMAARMWRHGIHSFLEVLRKRLPESWEFMDAFIHLVYPFLSLLEESVPQFDEIWIECKGDLSRYG